MRIRFDFSAKKSGKMRKPDSTNKHRVAFPKQVEEVVRTSDIILEVLDARYIDKTRNRALEKMILSQEKKIIFIINKIDIINLNEFKLNTDLTELMPYVLFSCKSKVGRSRLRERIKIEVKKLKMKDKKARVGIVGYPNVGKSSLINVLSGSKNVGTSPDAGYTKATHKIRFNKDILILDTPGIIPDKEMKDVKERDLKKHVQMGVKTYGKVRDPEFIVADFIKQKPGILEGYYGIECDGDSEILMEKLANKRNFVKKGGLPDTERAARLIIKDLQEGNIKVTL
jgi:ribosome biogenesis GTPase A